VESDEDKGSLAPFNDVQFDGTILVAEDNVINQKLIKQILMKYGISIDLERMGLRHFGLKALKGVNQELLDFHLFGLGLLPGIGPWFIGIGKFGGVTNKGGIFKTYWKEGGREEILRPN